MIMANKKLAPNRAAYDELCKSNKSNMELTLVRTNEATWLLVDKLTINPNLALINETSWQQVFPGWDIFLQFHSLKSLQTMHKVMFPDIPIGKAQATRESLAVLIWNARLAKATDIRKASIAAAEKSGGTFKNPMQRASAIATRTYTIIPPEQRPADAKQFTSPAGIACYNLIVECCGESGSCVEGDLKKLVEEKGTLITKSDKANAPWRFLQFYRPLLVESQWIAYQK